MSALVRRLSWLHDVQSASPVGSPQWFAAGEEIEIVVQGIEFWWVFT